MKCSYKRVSGVHYPKGSDPKAYNSATETRYGLCNGRDVVADGHFNAEAWQRLATHRHANQEGPVSIFSECFLQEFLDISVTASREVSLSFDKSSSEFVVLWGSSGNSGHKFDVNSSITLLHTHPRATRDSLEATMHSDNDIVSALIFSAAQHTPAISMVIGRICGGPIEVSTIMVEGAKVYVTNELERQWITSNVEHMNGRVRTHLKELGVTSFEVVVDKARVSSYAKKHAIGPSKESELMKAVRSKRPK